MGGFWFAHWFNWQTALFLCTYGGQYFKVMTDVFHSAPSKIGTQDIFHHCLRDGLSYLNAENKDPNSWFFNFKNPDLCCQTW